MKRGSILVALLVAGAAHADTDPAIARLEKALPAGWTLLATDTELVIRHDRPCYVTDKHEVAGASNGPLITIELRYRLEPRWTAKQLADARAANDKVAADLRALRAQYRIDAIHQSKGHPAPSNADERARVAAYSSAEASARARLVKTPRCTLGESSLFDDDAYRQLTLDIDPPSALKEANMVVALVKKECGAQ